MRVLSLIFVFCFLSISYAFSQNELMEVELAPTGSMLNEGSYLTRNTGHLRFVNGTGLNGEFQPRISGLADSDTSPGLVLVGTPSLINTSSTGILLRAGEAASITDGNILLVSNFTNPVMSINALGYLGVGTNDAKANVHVADGDVYIEEINAGVIMKDANGVCWRYTPDTSGVLNGVIVVCPN